MLIDTVTDYYFTGLLFVALDFGVLGVDGKSESPKFYRNVLLALKSYNSKSVLLKK